MEAYAEAAVLVAAEEHGMTLDYSADSVARLETVLAARIPVPEAQLGEAVKMWGGYFGEVLRRRYQAEWLMAVYPGSQSAEAAPMAMPALDIGGSQVYPLLKVNRRLTLGPAEELSGFFQRVTQALDSRVKKD